MKFVSIDRIFSQINRDLLREGLSEMDIIEWTGQALEFMGASAFLQPAIAFIEVANHQCTLPKHFHTIIQVARNNEYSVTTSDVTSSSESTEEDGDIPVAIDELGMPVNAYDVAYYRPYFDLIGEYYIGGLCERYNLKFTPVRLATHSFFDSIVCKQTDFEDLYTTCTDEYRIIDDSIMRFSFETGQVAISYLKYRFDCNTGYPMIPDNISYITAIVKFITMKIYERDFYAGREGAQAKLQKAEADWHWYCRQAKNFGKMPQTIDEWENLLNQRNYLLPRNKYKGFFGTLAHVEPRNMLI